LKPIKRPGKIKISETAKQPIRNYHLESDIFNTKPDNSKTLEAVRGYHNQSNVFINNEPKQGYNAIRSYHLESDILFQKGKNEKEKKGIKSAKINNETRNEPQKMGKIRRIEGKEFKRTYEEFQPKSIKINKSKNEPNPDNGLAYDFTYKPFKIGKTNKRLMPEKLNETEPKMEKGKKLFLIKNNEDPGSSLINH